MASTELVVRPEQIAPEIMEKVLVGGDLAKLTSVERVSYYGHMCQSLGLNPLTKPFEYIILNGKLTLYAKRDACDQLRANHGISITIKSREVIEGCYVVTAHAQTPTGRMDESIGAVQIDNHKGEARANAMMKAETKAKRRVTLSICGLGWTDESEIESIPSAGYVQVDHGTGEIVEKIDTGGERTGTKEAAQAVLKRKLAEGHLQEIKRVLIETYGDNRAEKSSVLGIVFGVRKWASVETMTPEELASGLERLKEHIRRDKQPPIEPITDEAALITERMVDIASTVDAFRVLKARLEKAAGTELAQIDYYNVLEAAKVKHSNEFKGDLVAARRCWLALYKVVLGYEKMQKEQTI